MDVTPAPSWIQSIELSSPSSIPVNDLSNGTYYLLYDRQINALAKETEYYRRYALQLLNTSAVEDNSQIQIDYDPSYERLQLHTLNVVRDGQIIEKSKTSRFQVLQSEREQDALIYNGALTLSIIIEDVRIGDVLDYSYTIYGSNPVLDGKFSTSLGTDWSVPIHQAEFSLLWPDGKPIKQRSERTADQMSVETNDGVSRYFYSVINSSARTLESDTPEWYEPWGRIYLSEYSDWSQVVDWAIPLYEAALDAQEGVAEQLVSLNLSLMQPEQKITQALFFNQQQIRYLGLEMGTNSHAPSSAETTLQRRYGDCKDKVVLLLAMLKRLGIEAYPALVNTETGETLTERLPSALAFDHVIVKVLLNSKVYWLDPTRSYQVGALDEIYQPDYGYALVIKKGVTELTRMAETTPNTSMLIEETFDLTQGVDQPGVLSVKTRYTGRDAEYQRNRFAQNSLQSISNKYQDYYQQEYGELLQASSLTINESVDGAFVSKEEYQLLQPWSVDDDQKQYYLDFYPGTLTEYTKEPSSVKRKDPLHITYPLDNRHIIKVKLPEGWHFNAESFYEKNNIFDFEAVYSFDATLSELTLDYRLRHLKSFVTPAEVERYRASLGKLDRYLAYQIYSTPPEKTFWEEVSANTSAPELLAIGSFGLVFILYIFSLIAWGIAARRYQPSEQIFYPVTTSRFMVLSLGTFLIYVSYWFYRNWRYVSVTDKPSVMPIMRGIFAWFWYFPLYSRLLQSSNQYFGENRLFSKVVAMFLAIAFMFAWFGTSAQSDLLSLTALIITPLLLLPLVNFIKQLNIAQGNKEAVAKNSVLRVYHFAVILGTGLLCLNYAAISSNITATQQILEGNALWKHHLQFFWDQRLVDAKRSPIMFYSDSVIDFRLDGNGFTKEGVFSYWQVNDQLVTERASFSDIESIKPAYSEDDLENTTVTITRLDGSEFVLYLNSEGKLDNSFVNELQSYWRHQR